MQLKVVRNQESIEISVELPSVVIVETTSAPNEFVTLSVSTASKKKVIANQKTSNDPLSTLTDGKLEAGFGPVFRNGIHSGSYRMDLGSVQPVNAITSWSFNQGGVRGNQRLTIYGSNSATDPGWTLSTFTQLGTIDTSGMKQSDFTGASLRTPSGKPLGDFRWIVWSVSPVTSTGGGENTAFQEFSVELTVQ